MSGRRLANGTVLLAAALLSVSACGSDAPETPTATPAPAVTASGAVAATYPATIEQRCTDLAGVLTVPIQPSGGGKTLTLILRAYHGPGVYSDLLGPAAGSGDTVQIGGPSGPEWIGDSGAVNVNKAAFTKIEGTLAVEMRPFSGGAAGTVSLQGDWTCAIANPTPSPAH